MRRLTIGALTAGVMLAVAALAVAATTQTASVRLTPSTLPAVQRAGVEFVYRSLTGTTNADGVQPAIARVWVFLDKDLRFTTRGLDRCSPEELDGKTTAQARAACRQALVGDGSAVARVSNGAGGHLDFPAEITAFNSTPFQGKPTIDLHVVTDVLITDIGLTITRRDGAYGWRLRTIGGGAPQPIRRLRVNLERSFVVRGDRRNYISARCDDPRLIYRAVYTYASGAPKTVSGHQNCRRG